MRRVARVPVTLVLCVVGVSALWTNGATIAVAAPVALSTVTTPVPRAGDSSLPASTPHATGHRTPPADLSYLTGRPLGIERRFYPAAYDLRTLGRVTPVRDQGYYGTCWAFAAFGSLESNLARDGITHVDLSEDNAVWFGGFNMHGSPYDDGGYSFMVLSYLARWGGPLLESDDPYADGIHPVGLPVRKHLQEAVFVPPRSSPTDNDALKAAVMTYGGVDVGITMDTSPAYWKESTDSFYYTGHEEIDHDVVVVGWDDAYAAGNFATRPPGNGAFIVRNSWGSWWGSSGYFRVSFYDTMFATDCCSMTFDLAEEPTNYTGIYQYDPLGYWPECGPEGGDTGWFANVFTATSSDPVAAVAFYTPLAGCDYEVSIGPSIAGASLRKSGAIATPGYHTVVLDAPVPVTAGTPFAVCVKLAVPDATYAYPIPVEVPIPDYSDAASANPGESFVSWDGTTWKDLTTVAGFSEANVCLKAFTTLRDIVAPATTDNSDDLAHRLFTLVLTATDAGSGVSFTEYRVDGGVWSTGTSVTLRMAIRHKRSGLTRGVHTVEYRSVDNAGNVEATQSCTVTIG